MARTSQVLDAFGRPMKVAELTREIAAPTTGGVRSPATGYPADGLTPVRLAQILREADAGNPLRYLELAEFIEERDAHYLGVLGTRRRSVSQLEITVEEASDDPLDVELAKNLRGWLKRGELTDELFDVLDCLGKGFSFTEIVWDRSSGQWMPDRLVGRDPRHFVWDPVDLATPMMLDKHGTPVPMPGGKFIRAQIKAKSGLAIRSGLTRTVAWLYLFKKFTERDWATFTQTYGQPLRLGKYQTGASEEDRDKLFRAVANIAGDCAAVIPESMQIEFVDTGNVSASTDLYERRADWYDKQVSKAVLGQTATTDAETGGLGSGTEHRMVQEDIERADARALGAILTRDLARPYVEANYPGHGRYPQIVIARPEAEDLKALSEALPPFIDRGLQVDADEILGKFGLKQPDKKARLLVPQTKSAPQTPPASGSADAKAPKSEFERGLNTPQAVLSGEGASRPQKPPEGRSEPLAPAIDRLADEAAPAMEAMLAQVEAMIETAGSLEEVRDRLLAGFPEVDETRLAQVLAQAMLAAHTGGRAMIEEEAG